MSWTHWSSEAFARAKAQGKPVLAARGRLPPESLKAAERRIADRFVAVLADPESRPDAAARVGEGHAVVLDPDGARRAVLPLPAENLDAALERLASEALRESSSRPDAAPAWTGAVREKPLGAAPDAARLDAVFASARAMSEPGLVELEALLYASAERGDAQARAALERGLAGMLSSPGWDGRRRVFESAGESALPANARRAMLLWRAHALTAGARWREAAEGMSRFLLEELHDPASGAFRRGPGSPVYPAEGNAQAAIALMRAAAFGVPGASDAASKALGFLQTRLYDPMLGLVHARGGGEESTVGLLGDAAWAALAFAKAYQFYGVKPHREFADALLRFLFQELWERESGGFLDRVPRADDPPILREPRVDPALNALALELCWRMHHLKGNANYRRWLDWGVRGAWPRDGAPSALLACAADMAGRGRLDLELVGRPQEPRSEALRAAVQRLYAPRVIVSFVDPDDQDYILAHKLEAESYPRLFACNKDLRRLADTDDPARVPELAAAARASEAA